MCDHKEADVVLGDCRSQILSKSVSDVTSDAPLHASSILSQRPKESWFKKRDFGGILRVQLHIERSGALRV